LNKNKNPNFFNPGKNASEPEVKVVHKEEDESEKEVKLSSTNQSSPSKKGHNFYYKENQEQMEDTPDFQDPHPGQEIEKPIDYASKQRGKQSPPKHKFAQFDLHKEDEDEAEAEEDDNERNEENSQQINRQKDLSELKQTSSKNKKHNFYEDYQYDKEYTEGINEFQQDSPDQKVEETPEDGEINAAEYVENIEIKDKQPQQQQRQYMRWERSEYKNMEVEREPAEPEQEYTSIAERIKTRKIQQNVEKENEEIKRRQVPEQKYQRQVDEPTYSRTMDDRIDQINLSNKPTQSAQIINRLQTLKDQ